MSLGIRMEVMICQVKSNFSGHRMIKAEMNLLKARKIVRRILCQTNSLKQKGIKNILRSMVK